MTAPQAAIPPPMKALGTVSSLFVVDSICANAVVCMKAYPKVVDMAGRPRRTGSARPLLVL